MLHIDAKICAYIYIAIIYIYMYIHRFYIDNYTSDRVLFACFTSNSENDEIHRAKKPLASNST